MPPRSKCWNAVPSKPYPPIKLMDNFVSAAVLTFAAKDNNK
jgi:hypothetical protein